MKTLLSAAMLVVLVASVSFAQSSATNVCVFAISTPLAVAEVNGDWGELVPGTTYTITADGFISPAELANGDGTIPTPMGWDITGQPGANVTVTFGLPGFFVGDDNADRVPYSVNTQSAGWTVGTGGFAPGDPYTPMDPRVPNTLTLDGGGEGQVQLGGIVSVPIGANSASYTGTFFLTAAYSGL